MRLPLPLDERLQRYVLDASLRESDALRELRAETATMPGWNMQVPPEEGQFLGLLVRATGARRALEIGVFTGYSLLCTALALPAGGLVTACDRNEEWVSVARKYCARAGVTDKVDFRVGDARETLETLVAEGAEPYDFTFIDADKPNYGAYVELALTLLRPGGLLVVDNVLWNGRVADPDHDDEGTLALRAVNTALHADQRVDISLLPFADGMTFAVKR